MSRKLVKHGTNTGYRTEIAANNEACQRCLNAHRVYNSQFTARSRAAGVKYSSGQVIDQLYRQNQSVPRQRAEQARQAPRTQPTENPRAEFHAERPGTAEEADSGQSDERSDPSLSERIRTMVVGEPGNPYVNDPDYPSYITADGIDPDPEPVNSEYIPIDASEYVINAAGMAKIEDSLGTYLSVFGITMEMIDPYCGPILAQNMNDIVKRWSKVIAKYPKAADLFMEGKGGTIMLWISALQATWPFLFAIYEHHFSHDVQTSGGNIYRKGSNTDRFARDIDPTAGQNQFTYTAG